MPTRSNLQRAVQTGQGPWKLCFLLGWYLPPHEAKSMTESDKFIYSQPYASSAGEHLPCLFESSGRKLFYCSSLFSKIVLTNWADQAANIIAPP
jgi:hypothetical protein